MLGSCFCLYLVVVVGVIEIWWFVGFWVHLVAGLVLDGLLPVLVNFVGFDGLLGFDDLFCVCNL